MKPITQWTTADIVEFAKSIDRPTWIKIGAGTAGVLLFIILIGWPAWVLRPKLKHEVEIREGQIQNVQTLSIRKPEYLKRKAASEQFIQNAKNRLFQPGEVALLLGTISKLADESKVSIVSSSPKELTVEFPPPFDAQYEASFFDFSVEGGYHEIGTFISRIETHPKIFRVQEFQLHPQTSEDADMSKRHMTVLTVSAVSLKVKKAVP